MQEQGDDIFTNTKRERCPSVPSLSFHINSKDNNNNLDIICYKLQSLFVVSREKIATSNNKLVNRKIYHMKMALRRNFFYFYADRLIISQFFSLAGPPPTQMEFFWFSTETICLPCIFIVRYPFAMNYMHSFNY